MIFQGDAFIYRHKPIHDRRNLKPAMQIIPQNQVQDMITSLCKNHMPSMYFLGQGKSGPPALYY